MDGSRSGRVNALVCAILDANGDTERLAEQMRFFSDLTDDDVDQAQAVAHWVKSAGGPQWVAQRLKPIAELADG